MRTDFIKQIVIIVVLLFAILNAQARKTNSQGQYLVSKIEFSNGNSYVFGYDENGKVNYVKFKGFIIAELKKLKNGKIIKKWGYYDSGYFPNQEYTYIFNNDGYLEKYIYDDTTDGSILRKDYTFDYEDGRPIRMILRTSYADKRGAQFYDTDHDEYYGYEFIYNNDNVYFKRVRLWKGVLELFSDLSKEQPVYTEIENLTNLELPCLFDTYYNSGVAELEPLIGWVPIRSKNLLKSKPYHNFIWNYAYEFDELGCPKVIKVRPNVSFEKPFDVRITYVE